MSGGYRRTVFTVVGGLTSAAFLAFLINDLSSVDQAYERTASNASRYYAENAEREVRQTCRLLPPDRQVDCVSKAETSARENQRVEQDLAAQKITAWWTKIMGAAALIGMALSALGVTLVWVTFREQRKVTALAYSEAKRAEQDAIASAKLTAQSLEIATRNAEAVVAAANAADVALQGDRAWMTLQGILFAPTLNVPLPNGGLLLAGLHFRVAWQNTGRSPSLNTKVTLQTKYINEGETIPDFPRQTPPPELPGETIGPAQSIQTIPKHDESQDAQAALAGKKRLIVYSSIEYRDVFRDVERFSEVTQEIVFTGGPNVKTANGIFPANVVIAIGPQNRVT